MSTRAVSSTPRENEPSSCSPLLLAGVACCCRRVLGSLAAAAPAARSHARAPPGLPSRPASTLFAFSTAARRPATRVRCASGAHAHTRRDARPARSRAHPLAGSGCAARAHGGAISRRSPKPSKSWAKTAAPAPPRAPLPPRLAARRASHYGGRDAPAGGVHPRRALALLGHSSPPRLHPRSWNYRRGLRSFTASRALCERPAAYSLPHPLPARMLFAKNTHACARR
jgi:hypothetical protein